MQHSLVQAKLKILIRITKILHPHMHLIGHFSKIMKTVLDVFLDTD